MVLRVWDRIQSRNGDRKLDRRKSKSWLRVITCAALLCRCLIYELATGQPPFTAANQVALARKVVTEPPPKLPIQYSADLGRLVSAMLEKDPQARISVAEILRHPVVRDCALRIAAERGGVGELPDEDTVQKWTAAGMQQEFEARLSEAKAEVAQEYQERLESMQEQLNSQLEEMRCRSADQWAQEERRLVLALSTAEQERQALQGQSPSASAHCPAHMRDGTRASMLERQLFLSLHHMPGRVDLWLLRALHCEFAPPSWP